MIETVCLLCAENLVKVTHLCQLTYVQLLQLWSCTWDRRCSLKLKRFQRTAVITQCHNITLPAWISAVTREGTSKGEALISFSFSLLIFRVSVPKPKYWKLSFFLVYHCKNDSYNSNRLKTENHNFTNDLFYIILDKGKTKTRCFCAVQSSTNNTIWRSTDIS